MNVKTITIQVEPVYFNLDVPTEKMIIKRNQVTFKSKNRLYEGYEDYMDTSKAYQQYLIEKEKQIL